MQNYPVQFKLAKRREITISRKESKRISRIEIYEKVRELASKMEVNKEPLTLENFICLIAKFIYTCDRSKAILQFSELVKF